MSTLSQDPSKFAICRFRARRATSAPASAGSRSANPSSRSRPTSIDMFAGNLIVSLTPENTVSVEEAYGILTAAPYGLVPKFGRFFSGLGLHERAASARVGLRRRAARLPGVPRRRSTATTACSSNGSRRSTSSSSSAPRSATATASRDCERNKNGVGIGRRLRAHRRRHRREPQLARRRCRTCRRARRTATTRRSTSRATTRRLASTARAMSRSPTSSGSTRPTATRMDTNFKLQGEYFWRRENGDLTYDADGALGLTQTAAYTSSPERLVPAGRLPVHAVLARRRALRPPRPGTRRLRRQRIVSGGARVPSGALHADVRLHAVGIQPHPPAARAEQDADRASPTTSSFSSTS